MTSKAKPVSGRVTKTCADDDRLRKELRAYALKRYEQIAEVAALRTARGGGQSYLQFHTSGGNICDVCRRLDGMTLPIDSPIWRFCTPLCHDLCKCFFSLLSERDLKEYGYKVSGPRAFQIHEYRDEQTGRIVQWDWEGAIRRHLDARGRRAAPQGILSAALRCLGLRQRHNRQK
jgi:hypothetical protein